MLEFWLQEVNHDNNSTNNYDFTVWYSICNFGLWSLDPTVWDTRTCQTLQRGFIEALCSRTQVFCISIALPCSIDARGSSFPSYIKVSLPCPQIARARHLCLGSVIISTSNPTLITHTGIYSPSHMCMHIHEYSTQWLCYQSETLVRSCAIAPVRLCNISAWPAQAAQYS